MTGPPDMERGARPRPSDDPAATKRQARGDSTSLRGADTIAKLDQYRDEAREARRSDRPLNERLVALIDLMTEARREPDPWIRETATQIVEWQAAWLLQGDEALRRAQVRDRLERAARRLRLQGYECCPTCEQRLSDPLDWVTWTALKRIDLDRLEALDRETKLDREAKRGGGAA